MKIESSADINAIESESGIVATLIHHPDFVFCADDYLYPEHFTNTVNKCMYMAIRNMVQDKKVSTIDPYNIISYLNSSKSTKEFTNILTVEKLNELIEVSDVLCRNTPEEYKMLADNVVDAAFRRNVFLELDKCQSICMNGDRSNLEQQVYGLIDNVMGEYSGAKDFVQYKDVVDTYWEEIKERQGGEYAGIPFKFERLNQYATLEQGELFIFAADTKQGKSIMLLNCAVDLMRKGYSVLYLDSELNSRLFTERLLAHLSRIEYVRLKNGNYTEEEAQRIDAAREWIKDKHFAHVYLPTFDMQSIYFAVKKMKHFTGGLDVLIVDYFKGSGDGSAWDSYAELGKFTDFVKNTICGDMKICGLGAAQATSLGKVADSAKISRNASTIALIQEKTQDEIEEDGIECGNKKLTILFNRNGMQHAPGEYIDLQFNGNLISYEEAKQHIPILPY